jgi:murein DD-endopeptidase MepM/ murein hydrolase activator NlpD
MDRPGPAPLAPLALIATIAGCGTVASGAPSAPSEGLAPRPAVAVAGLVESHGEPRLLARHRDHGADPFLPFLMPTELAAAALVTTPPSPSDGLAHSQRSRSSALPNGLFNPMPGGVMAGYRGDTGLDIAGNRQPVYAIATGTLDYSEPGHTLWIGPGDTANTVRLKLDEPIPFDGRQITHAWYAHLSKLRYQQAEGADQRIAILAGEQLGVSGVANGSPHLHIGLLLDDVVSQRWGSYLLEDQIRAVLGGFRHRQRLPRAQSPSSPGRAR